MIFHGRLSDRNYGCRQRPRYLIFSQFSIGPILLPKCVCLRGSASDPTGGFRRPQLANVGYHHCRGPHRIAGPRAPRPHDPPLVTTAHELLRKVGSGPRSEKVARPCFSGSSREGHEVPIITLTASRPLNASANQLDIFQFAANRN